MYEGLSGLRKTFGVTLFLLSLVGIAAMVIEVPIAMALGYDPMIMNDAFFFGTLIAWILGLGLAGN